MSHACRQVLAAHPGDELGARDTWKPSKKPDAWLSTGACLLPGAPNPEEAQPPDLDDVIEKESIGDIKWRMPAEALIAKLGKPTTKGRITMEEATGSALSDDIVDPKSHETVCNAMNGAKQTTCTRVPLQAEHEIFIERDEVRTEAFRQMLGFMGKVAPL